RPRAERLDDSPDLLALQGGQQVVIRAAQPRDLANEQSEPRILPEGDPIVVQECWYGSLVLTIGVHAHSDVELSWKLANPEQIGPDPIEGPASVDQDASSIVRRLWSVDRDLKRGDA